MCAALVFGIVRSVLDAHAAFAEEPPSTPPPAERQPLVWRPWPIFDPYLSRQGLLLEAQALRYHTLGAARHAGLGIGVGQSTTTVRGPLQLTGRMTWGLRFVPGEVLAAHIGRYSYAAGFRLGPFFPEVAIGTTLLGVDLADGHLGFGLLSPHVGAGVAILFKDVRIGVRVTSEYWWRWDRRDARFEALVVDIALEVPPRGIPSRYKGARSAAHPD